MSGTTSGPEPAPRARLLPPTAALVIEADYDWADERGSRALADPATLADQHGRRQGRRLDRLIVIRESDMYDRHLLEAGLRQACLRNADAPRVAEVEAAGLAPLYDPQFAAFERTLTCSSGLRVAFYQLGGVGWMLSPASAKSADDNGENAFTNYLCERLQELRPRILDAAAFSRLVRSLEHGARLGLTCLQNVEVLRAGELTLDFVHNQEMAHGLFHYLAGMAANERNEIVRNHTAGVLMKYRSGAWVLNTVPFGYVLDHAGRLRPDASRRDAVHAMLQILPASMSNTDKIGSLQQCGVLNRTQSPAHAGSQLRTLARWIPLYVAGQWLVRWKNPTALPDWVGVPVDGRDDRSPGYFVLRYDVGVPDGGWAPEPVLSEALQWLRHRRTSTRAMGKRGGTLPLTGYRARGRIGRTRVAEVRLCSAAGRYELRIRQGRRP